MSNVNEMENIKNKLTNKIENETDKTINKRIQDVFRMNSIPNPVKLLNIQSIKLKTMNKINIAKLRSRSTPYEENDMVQMHQLTEKEEHNPHDAP